MASNRNRSAGYAFELEIVNRLKATKFFPHVATSRLVSRMKDALKIDITNTDDSEHGELQYNFQTKTLVNQPNFLDELKKMPIKEGIANIFLLKKTVKKGTRFFTQGNLAVMSEDDFFRLITDRERFRIGYQILNDRFDSISDEEKPEIHELLNSLDLR